MRGDGSSRKHVRTAVPGTDSTRRHDDCSNSIPAARQPRAVAEGFSRDRPGMKEAHAVLLLRTDSATSVAAAARAVATAAAAVLLPLPNVECPCLTF